MSELASLLESLLRDPAERWEPGPGDGYGRCGMRNQRLGVAVWSDGDPAEPHNMRLGMLEKWRIRRAMKDAAANLIENRIVDSRATKDVK